MASATYLQSLDSVYEDGTPRGITPSNRRQIESFIVAEPIAKNDMVCLDLAQTGAGKQALYIKKANRTAGATILAIGFALEDATAADVSAGKAIQVTVAGAHSDAAVVAAATQGARLIAPDVGGGGTAGRAEQYTGAESVPVIAYALENASAANTADVFVIKQF
jgi:hypothetical protein